MRKIKTDNSDLIEYLDKVKELKKPYFDRRIQRRIPQTAFR